MLERDGARVADPRCVRCRRRVASIDGPRQGRRCHREVPPSRAKGRTLRPRHRSRRRRGCRRDAELPVQARLGAAGLASLCLLGEHRRDAVQLDHRLLGSQREAGPDRRQGSDERLGRGDAGIWALGQRVEHQLAQVARDAALGVRLGEWHRRVEEVPGNERRHAGAPDRVLAGEQLVEHQPEGVEVAARVDRHALLGVELLGRGVAHLAEEHPGAGQAAAVDRLCPSSSRTLAIPRSISLMSGCPSSSRDSMRLSGEMSRWMMLRRCR